MRLLSNAGAILLILYKEKKGLLTPEIVSRMQTLSQETSLQAANVALGHLETTGHVKKEKTDAKTDRRRNPPNRIHITNQGKLVANGLIKFITRQGLGE